MFKLWLSLGGFLLEKLNQMNSLMRCINKWQSYFFPQDEARTQKALKQKNTLEAVNNSVKLLNEMLAHFSPEDSTDGDKELIRVRQSLDNT